MIDLTASNNVSTLKQLKNGDSLSSEVVIIGSGAGGGISAEKFALAGFEVLIIEEGPLKTQKDFTLKESQAYPDLYQEAASRRTKDKGITILQGRAVGGSTTVNWTSSFRTPIQTLDFWKEQFGIDGLSESELNPWFDKAERALSITPWELPPNPNNHLLSLGAKKLKWASKVIPRNVKGCANLGYCGMGCPIGAKQSMLVTTIPKAVEAGARLVTRARCERILWKGRVASGVELSVIDDNGQVTDRKVKVSCKHLILSAGAIGTPAILLRSGIPDPNHCIGARTFLHPVTASAAIMPEKVDAFSGAPQSIYSDEFLWRDGVQGEAGYKLEVPPVHPVIASGILPYHGKQHFELMSQLPYLQATIALIRDGFHLDSVGGQVILDKHNYPVLDYPMTEYLWRSVRHAMLSMAELQFAAGAKSVMPLHMDARMSLNWEQAKAAINQLSLKTPRTLMFSAHVMGGCSMGSRPKNSVVNSKGQSYSLDNVHVFDGSILPSSLGVNPQLTLFAITSKLASDLIKRIQ